MPIRGRVILEMARDSHSPAIWRPAFIALPLNPVVAYRCLNEGNLVILRLYLYMELNEIIKIHNVNDIEHALVSNYLKRNNIDACVHPDIARYLSDYTETQQLNMDVASMKHVSLSELAVDMELLIPEEDRQTNGAFFTPSHIVDFIVENVHLAESSAVIDISCGCGAFLLGAIRHFENKYKKTISSIVSDNIFGVDLLNYNVRRCKLLIMLYGLSRGEIIEASAINVICDNSLTRKWQRKYDAVIGNPPYVKFQDMEESTRTILEKQYKTTGFGTYNLYFAFFEIGLNLLNKNGALGYITPNNYFTSLSGESLRAFFQSTKTINRIVDFNATKVFDVQTYTAITFLTKSENEHIEYSRIGTQQDIPSYLSHIVFTKNEYKNLTSKKWRLLCSNERDIIQCIEQAGTQIGKLFNIAVGIATLKDEAFFLSPIKEDKEYYYCENKYQSNIKIEKAVTRPHVKISKIKSPEDLSSNDHRIIFPYTVNDGVASIIPEDIMKSNFPCCYSYLLSVRDVLSQRGKGKHIYSPFYSYGRTQGLNKNGVKIYTPTFSQYPRFIFDSNPVSLFTNGYGIFYRENQHDEESLFSSDSTNPITDIQNVDVLLKILNSGLMHFYITKTSVAIEGGYPCYQKNFIELFSIPALNNEDINQLRKLFDRDEIDEYLLSLYHINLPSPNLWE